MLYFNQKKGKEIKTMSNAEYINWMENRAKEMTLEQLKDAQFMNNMVDRWQWSDRVWADILSREIYSRKNK